MKNTSDRKQHPIPRCSLTNIGLSLDISSMGVEKSFFEKMEPSLQKAFQSMADLEAGAIANPDENRMVGHYWLRAPRLAPDAPIKNQILSMQQQVKDFARKIHETGKFRHLLLIGIGGSALGPQFVSEALARPGSDQMTLHFLDNTDPDGMEKTLHPLLDELEATLCVIVSKSGITPETRNGLKVVQRLYEENKITFSQHAVVITQEGSVLDKEAKDQGWLAHFPMWDWVGGRTSEMSAVGLLPAALQGIDVEALLEGAALCDEATRSRDTYQNPAALIALMWHAATEGHGKKDCVILPYKDRLQLFSRYLQQLVMESLGKEKDLKGKKVKQGLTVYGNKGSTDQHAYVQQLRDGLDNFFVTFIEVLENGGYDFEVEPQITVGDYLHAFLLGTREALSEKGRQSMTLTLQRLDARTIGALVALFERAVGLYAFLININAYHQPGVEAGKKAAAGILEVQRKILDLLGSTSDALSVEEIAEKLQGSDARLISKMVEYLEVNGRIRKKEGANPAYYRYSS